MRPEPPSGNDASDLTRVAGALEVLATAAKRRADREEFERQRLIFAVLALAPGLVSLAVGLVAAFRRAVPPGTGSILPPALDVGPPLAQNGGLIIGVASALLTLLLLCYRLELVPLWALTYSSGILLSGEVGLVASRDPIIRACALLLVVPTMLVFFVATETRGVLRTVPANTAVEYRAALAIAQAKLKWWLGRYRWVVFALVQADVAVALFPFPALGIALVAWNTLFYINLRRALQNIAPKPGASWDAFVRSHLEAELTRYTGQTVVLPPSDPEQTKTPGLARLCLYVIAAVTSRGVARGRRLLRRNDTGRRSCTGTDDQSRSSDGHD
jgi:hypothetical protein